MNRLVKLLFIFTILLLIDISLKLYTYFNIPLMSWIYPFYPYGGVGVFENFFGISFSINHVQNTGAAWGIFSSYSKYLFFLRIVIIISLIIYMFRFNKNNNNQMPFILIITGAIGNILDFFFYHKVIDMFHLKFWGYTYPVFNIADALITIGITWLILLLFIKRMKKARA